MTPSTTWQELIPADENARFESHAQALAGLQQRRAKGAVTHRALHAKANVGAHAELTVLPNLPEHARAGLFATPATYRAYVRYSNGNGQPVADAKPDVRGVAIKLLGVSGKKLIPGLQDATTQDFLLVKNATLPFRNTDEFVAFMLANENPALMLPRLISAVGLSTTFGILKKAFPIVQDKTPSLATIRYFAPGPIKFGAYAVRCNLQPSVSDAATSKPGKTFDYLHEELAQRLKSGPVSYDFRVQFYLDEALTPLEDVSTPWKETDSPFMTVAKLTLPQQELDSDYGKKLAAYIETLSFDPWHAQEELRPLGSIMRARNYAYRLSTQARNAVAEPLGSELLPR